MHQQQTGSYNFPPQQSMQTAYTFNEPPQQQEYAPVAPAAALPNQEYYQIPSNGQWGVPASPYTQQPSWETQQGQYAQPVAWQQSADYAPGQYNQQQHQQQQQQQQPPGAFAPLGQQQIGQFTQVPLSNHPGWSSQFPSLTVANPTATNNPINPNLISHSVGSATVNISNFLPPAPGPPAGWSRVISPAMDGGPLHVAMCLDESTNIPFLACTYNTTSRCSLLFVTWDTVQTRWGDPVIVDMPGNNDLIYRQVSIAFDASTRTVGIAYCKIVQIPDYNPTPQIWLARASDANYRTWATTQVSHPPGKPGDGNSARCPAMVMANGKYYIAWNQTNPPAIPPAYYDESLVAGSSGSWLSEGDGTTFQHTLIPWPGTPGCSMAQTLAATPPAIALDGNGCPWVAVVSSDANSITNILLWQKGTNIARSVIHSSIQNDDPMVALTFNSGNEAVIVAALVQSTNQTSDAVCIRLSAVGALSVWLPRLASGATSRWWYAVAVDKYNPDPLKKDLAIIATCNNTGGAFMVWKQQNPNSFGFTNPANLDTHHVYPAGDMQITGEHVCAAYGRDSKFRIAALKSTNPGLWGPGLFFYREP